MTNTIKELIRTRDYYLKRGDTDRAKETQAELRRLGAVPPRARAVKL